MSIDMYLADSNSQASSTKTLSTCQTQGYTELKSAINGFAYFSPFLQGDAYSTAKSYFTAVLRPLAQGGALLAEYGAEAVQKFPDQYVAEVDSGDLKQSELEEKIRQMEQQISNLQSIRQSISSSDMPSANKLGHLAANALLQGIYGNAKRELEEKLQKLLAFNGSSPSIFADLAALQSAVNQGLGQTKSVFNPATGTFAVPQDLSWVKAIEDAPFIKKAKEQYADYLDEYPEDLDKVIAILKYEENRPDYVDTTNEFLSPLEMKDQVEIKFMIYTADEPYATLCLKYMGEFEIADINTGGVFSSSKNTLVFNVVEDRTNPRGAYYTFFHEMGHAIDYYYAQENGGKSGEFFSDNFTYNGKTLTEHNYQDVANNMEKSMQDILAGDDYNHLTDKEKQQIIKNVNNNLLNQNRHEDSLSDIESDIQDALITEYQNKLHGPANNTASDIYGGVTDNTVKGDYGHKDGYWFDSDGNVIRNPNKECFAGYFGRKMVGEPAQTNGLDSIDKYLSESTECMEATIDEMGRDIE